MMIAHAQVAKAWLDVPDGKRAADALVSAAKVDSNLRAFNEHRPTLTRQCRTPQDQVLNKAHRQLFINTSLPCRLKFGFFSPPSLLVTLGVLQAVGKGDECASLFLDACELVYDGSQAVEKAAIGATGHEVRPYLRAHPYTLTLTLALTLPLTLTLTLSGGKRRGMRWGRDKLHEKQLDQAIFTFVSCTDVSVAGSFVLKRCFRTPSSG